MMLNPDTGIHADNPRWPLHILKPVEPIPGRLEYTASAFFTQHCATPYVQPHTTDPAVFAAALERGRLICECCAGWLRAAGKL